MTFTSGGATLCSATLPALSCQTATSLDAGTYPVTATYSGDSNYNGTVATGASFTVTAADVSFTESAAPSSVEYGTSDTVSTTGLPADAAGTITFTSGGTTLCTATLPAISCQTSTTLAAGTYPVTATYSGCSDYNGGVATGASFTVAQADPSMIESASPASIAYGTQDTLSASGLPGDATGTVTFWSHGSALCTLTLPATDCESASTLAPGVYPVSAVYSGDGNYDGLTATGASFTVTKADVFLTETASPLTIVYGSTDTLAAAGLPAGATGTLTFTSGTTALCTATLTATSCATAATLTPATYPVTASYSGDVNDSAATATGAEFTVIKADTHMTVIVSPTETVPGAPVTLWVTGLPAGVSGTVTFTYGHIILCTALLPAMSCTTTVALPPGTYAVKATYSGDADYNGTNAMGSGEDGALSIVNGVADPTTGSGPMGPRVVLGAALAILGGGMIVISRGRRRSARKI